MTNYDIWFKTAPKQLNSGLTIIKKIKNDHIILIGGNNISGTNRYEMLGGRYEYQDKTALHTGIREFIEELFNLKLDAYKLDKLVEHLINHNHIMHDMTIISETSSSYFASFKTLELIYNFVYHGKYDIVEPLDFPKFIETRNSNSSKVNCIKADGLCEIEFISVVYLSKAHLLPLRESSFNLLNKFKNRLL
jgi:hypothetical protein